MSQPQFPTFRMPPSELPRGETGTLPSLEDVDDRLLDGAIAEYLERLDCGEVIDRRDFLARHSQLTQGLQAFFEDCDEVQRVVGFVSPPSERREPPLRVESETDPIGRIVQAAAAMCAANPQPTIEVPAGIPSRYQVDGILGQGGMGLVFLAHDTHLNRRVALKVPHATALNDPDRIERFRVEARAAAKLQHSNICPIFDVGEMQGAAQGLPYITMAYINGRTLAAWIAKTGPLPPRQATSLIAKLAAALHAAHTAGVVHRDLKPANIMIDQHDEPIITDFGLALLLDQRPDIRLTRIGNLMGTPAYMSPEQMSGNPSKVDVPTDIYSLGVLMFELLTGRLPFEGSSEAIIAKVLTENPPCLHELRSDIPPQLDGICRRMMAREQQDRYPDMQAVRDALDSFLQSDVVTDGSATETPPVLPLGLMSLPMDTAIVAQDTTASPSPSPTPPRAPVKTRRKATALSALALVVAAVGWNLFSNASSGKTRITVDDSVPHGLELRVDGEPIRLGETGVERRLPEGLHTWSIHRGDDLLRTEEFLVAQGKGGDVTLTLKDPAGDSPQRRAPLAPSKPVLLRTLAGPGVEFVALALQPNTPQLAVAGEHSIDVHDYRSERTVRTIPLPPEADIGALAFDVTGTHLAIGTPLRTYLASVAAGDGAGDRPLETVDHTGTGATSLAYSSDGSWLAVAMRGENVKLVKCSGDIEPPLLKGDSADAELVVFSPVGDLLITSHRVAGLRLWDLKTGALRSSIETVGLRVFSLAFSADGAILAVGGSGGSLVLREVAAGELSKELIGHAGDVVAIAFHPSGRYVASGSHDHTVRIWDIEAGKELHKLYQRDKIESVAFSSEGDLLVAAAGKSIPVWQLPATMLAADGPGLISTLDDHRGIVLTVDFSPDGRYLLSGGGNSTDFENRPDSKIRLWDANTGSLDHVFESGLEQVKKARFSADGGLIIAMSPDGLFEFWDVASKKRAHSFEDAGFGPVGIGPVKDFAVMRNRPQVVVAGTEGHAIVRLSDLKIVSHWKKRGERIGAVAAWNDGRSPWLISGSFTGDNVTIWNASLVESTASFKASGNSVLLLGVTPDGRYALCGNIAGHTLVDLADRTQLHTWNKHGPNGPIYDRWIGAISPDGARVLLATQSNPPVLVLIDAASGEPLHEFRGHGGSAIPAVAVSPDGAVAASGGLDGKVKLWRLPEKIDYDRRAAEWAVRSGGTVEIRMSGAPTRTRHVETLADLPAGPFECVVVQFENNPELTDAGLKNITGLRHLEELTLVNVPLTDAALVYLTGLPRLERLRLDGTQVTDLGIEELGQLVNLRQLSLRGTAVFGTTLSKLFGAHLLRELVLDHTHVTDDSLRWLTGFSELTDLYLGNTHVSDAGLEHLWQLKKLRLLDCQFSEVTDAGVRKMQQKFPQLKFVPAQ